MPFYDAFLGRIFKKVLNKNIILDTGMKTWKWREA